MINSGKKQQAKTRMRSHTQVVLGSLPGLYDITTWNTVFVQCSNIYIRLVEPRRKVFTTDSAIGSPIIVHITSS